MGPTVARHVPYRVQGRRHDSLLPIDRYFARRSFRVLERLEYNGADRPPMYETFVITQLVPLIDANFRTKDDRAHRAIPGD